MVDGGEFCLRLGENADRVHVVRIAFRNVFDVTCGNL